MGVYYAYLSAPSAFIIIPVAAAMQDVMKIRGPKNLWYGMTTFRSRTGAYGKRNTRKPARNWKIETKLNENTEKQNNRTIQLPVSIARSSHVKKFRHGTSSIVMISTRHAINIPVHRTKRLQ